MLRSGDKLYYVDNKLHRLDGPAIECVMGLHYYFNNNKEFWPT